MIPKFRAWSVEHQVMLDVYSLFWYPDGKVSLKGEALLDKKHLDVQDVVGEQLFLMQSTGLIDKNGVEIFEGDVIECTHQNGTTFNGVVTYDEKNAFWGVTDHRYKELSAIPAFNGYLSQVATCEVAGNAYENPELVEVE